MSNKSQEIESEKKIVIGIDATNLRQGGGRTHLIELLHVVNPEIHSISQVVVWGSQSTLALLNRRPWLKKLNPPLQERGFLARSFWQCFHLTKAAQKAGCDVLFTPGGSYSGNFHLVVTMSRNMLPFEWHELRRYGWSLITLKLILLRLIQSRAFRRANGVVFLTEYAKSVVKKKVGKLSNTRVIPHGINNRFTIQPTAQRMIETYSAKQPYRILYISIIDQYKHQWHVVEAISNLRELTGWNLRLDLVGPAYPPALRRLQSSMRRFDLKENWVSYHGAVSFDQLHRIYKEAHLGLFASSCENLPNILLETMAAGLPIACSNRGPMPEILGNAGIYFNPEDPQDIADALQRLITSPTLRTSLANASFTASKQYTWKRSADEVLTFLMDVYSKNTLSH